MVVSLTNHKTYKLFGGSSVFAKIPIYMFELNNSTENFCAKLAQSANACMAETWHVCVYICDRCSFFMRLLKR